MESQLDKIEERFVMGEIDTDLHHKYFQKRLMI